MDGIIFETARCYIRKFTKEDIKIVAEICNNIEFYYKTTSLPFPYTEDDARDWIDYLSQAEDENRYLTFALVKKEEEKLIGCISLEISQVHKHAVLGYWLEEKEWNKGYISEGCKRIVEYFFLERGYHRLYAEHYDFNKASGRVMEKIGMKYEGTFVDHYKRGNKYLSVIRYGMIEGDYFKLREEGFYE